MNFSKIHILRNSSFILLLVIIAYSSGTSVYGDFIELWNLRIPTEKPNICFFEPQEPITNQMREYLLSTSVFAVKEWEDRLNNATNSWNFNMTYHYILNSTHFNKNYSDFKYCSVLITNWDNPIEKNVLGITHYDHSNSSHKFAVIEIYPIIRANDTFYSFMPEKLKIVVQHEFGHAMGIGHHNKTPKNNFDSIMIPAWNMNENIKITEDDIKAALQLYGKSGFQRTYRDVPDNYEW